MVSHSIVRRTNYPDNIFCYRYLYLSNSGFSISFGDISGFRCLSRNFFTSLFRKRHRFPILLPLITPFRANALTSSGLISSITAISYVLRIIDIVHLWEAKRCPNFIRLAERYLAFTGLGSISIGTRSTTRRPYPSRATILRGLFVIRRISRTPRSLRICAPVPYSLKSGRKPSFSFASTVSRPLPCEVIGKDFLRQPYPPSFLSHVEVFAAPVTTTSFMSFLRQSEIIAERRRPGV